MPLLLLFNLLVLRYFSRQTLASTLSPLQYQGDDYSTCAQACFETNADEPDCPFDTSGTHNACLCGSESFLVDFMTCTFESCGGELLVSTADISVSNCDSTNTLAVLTAAQLMSAGREGTDSVPSSTSELTYMP
jgi:hypothetical protein